MKLRIAVVCAHFTEFENFCEAKHGAYNHMAQPTMRIRSVYETATRIYYRVINWEDAEGKKFHDFSLITSEPLTFELRDLKTCCRLPLSAEYFKQ